MIPVLVTGGAGYIGSHTAKQLARAGFYPVVLDNLSRGHARAVKWGPLVCGDLADSELIRRVIEGHAIQAILHFAAYAYVGESMVDPRAYFSNNVQNTLKLLDVAVELGIKNIVFSSTCATYGVPENVPISEEEEQRPVNPYGEAKLFIERALYWYGQAYGLRWVALRYFNAAGADPEGEIGEDHEPETHLIPRLIQAALGQLPAVEIYGTDYPTPDGTAVRDYIHVMDLAEAHVLALQHLFRGGQNLALNLGTGRGHSVREVIDTVENLSGHRVPVTLGARREGDPPILVAHSRRAMEALGWSPRQSSLNTIVRTALSWQQGALRARSLSFAKILSGNETREFEV